MIRRFSLFLVCVLVYAVFLLFTFPAIHAWGFLKPQLPPIKANRIEGSIWNAQVSNLQIGRLKFAKVKAGIEILPLFAGKLAIHAQLKGQGYSSTSSVNISANKIELSDLKATMLASGLSNFAYPGVRLLGKLRLNFKTLTFHKQGLIFAQGSSVWSNAVIHGPLKLNLGKIVLSVKTYKNKIRGTFINKGTTDKIKGSIDIQANGLYHLKIFFTPAHLSAEQRSWLLTISKTGPNGSYKFSNKGNLLSSMNSTGGKR